MRGTNYVYRIPLRYLVDLGLVNFPINLIRNLETNYTKLFESQKEVTTIRTTQPDAKIIFHNRLYVQYEQIKLNSNFREYLEASLK